MILFRPINISPNEFVRGMRMSDTRSNKSSSSFSSSSSSLIKCTETEEMRVERINKIITEQYQW